MMWVAHIKKLGVPSMSEIKTYDTIDIHKI